MKLLLPILLLTVSQSALALPGAKRNLGTIKPKAKEPAAEERTRQLGDAYSLVGTISCDACASPFQPVAVIRELQGQKLLHLRVGDELSLSGGEHVVVTAIDSGAVELKGAYATYKLRAGGFPDVVVDDGAMIANKPKTYVPPPANGARW